MPNKPLKLGERLKRLKKYGVITLKRRGKGSERILLLPNREGDLKGLRFTIRVHGNDTEIYGPVIQAILRRFSIDADEFWEE